ncbi:MAG: nucleotidyltransferase domain-containing protein [Bacteroidales bacterium]|nr:nucleotidyltransferase domain-containing protein [Bacteroidales bacterium]MBQ1655074.1 nucleotidyltransferase domain-containing protein [Bacteroidales bacterium]MBQ2575327.1 nucleotidyltransferase domain-containing protein [Bacteroidales bacterium]MBR5983131.1 nucleotidyltransferase domain-containing protein [Bacteroidales bacterium]
MLTQRTKQMLPLLRESLSKQDAIARAWLFGSCSRGEEQPDSDVDLLVQYIDSDHISLMTICRIKRDIEKSINRNVDLVEDGCLMPFAKESANQDKILIYERAN